MIRLTMRGGLMIGLAILIAYLILLTALGYLGNEAKKELVFPDAEGPKEMVYDFRYQGKSFTIRQTLYETIYRYYQEYSDRIPEIKSEEEYYQFIKDMHQTNDTITGIVELLRGLAAEAGYSADQTFEFAMRFVQSIPYDVVKSDQVSTFALDTENPPRLDLLPRHPYITLYDNRGICSDKTVLALAIAEEMGYGTAIFSFDGDSLGTGVGHVGLGVKCPPSYSIYNSGYCYIETTAPLRIGVTDIFLSPNLQASSAYASGKENDPGYSLDFASVEIKKLDEGATYHGIIETYRLEERVQGLSILVERQQQEIERQRTRLNQLNSSLTSMASQYIEFSAEEYDMVFEEYSREVERFNLLVEAYNQNVEEYNKTIEALNN